MRDIREVIRARAFNLGSDARIQGVQYISNPFFEAAEPDQYRWWHRGWRDVDRNWGIEAHWPIRTLPEVTREAHAEHT